MFELHCPQETGAAYLTIQTRVGRIDEHRGERRRPLVRGPGRRRGALTRGALQPFSVLVGVIIKHRGYVINHAIEGRSAIRIKHTYLIFPRSPRFCGFKFSPPFFEHPRANAPAQPLPFGMWMPRQPATLCCSRLPLENLDGGGGGDSCRRLGWFKFTGAYEVPGESQRQTATPGGVAARASRSVAHAEMEGEWRRGGERGVLEECRENEIQQLCDRIRFLLRNFL